MTHNEIDAGSKSDNLMTRLAGKDVAALAPLYLEYASLAKRALLRFAPDCTAAELEELLQDVFLALYDSAPRYPFGLGIERWLWGIAAKKAIFWRRKTWVRRKLLRMHGEPVLGVARATSASPETTTVLRMEISKAVSALPNEQRDVLLLYAAEGFSGEEIAEILGIKRETVRTRLFRARQKIMELVPDTEIEEATKGNPG